MARSLVSLAAAAVAGCLTISARAGAQVDTAQQRVRIGLEYQAGTRPGVIVLPVRGAAGDSVRLVLQRDLDYGDRANVVTGSAADTPLGADGRVNYELAARLGAAAMIQGTVLPNGALRVVAHDVARKQVLTTRDFILPGAPSSATWRLAVHGASDEIEQWLTGVRGIAATRLLFVRDNRVWVVDSDGENARAVTDRGALSPGWHPNGAAFTYSTLSDRGEQRIMAKDVDGSPRTLASGGVVNISPIVSPDGATVVYAHAEEGGTDLYAVPWTGGSPRRITAGRGSVNTSPSFSPDGRRIAFTSGRAGHPEVYITDADGGDVDVLTSYDPGDQNYRSNPDWSPDNRLVAFQSMVGGQFQVFTIGLRDRSARRLTTEGANEDPSWAPDARHLVVTSTRTGTRQLFVIDTETGRARQLTRGGATRMPEWSSPLARGP